MNPEIRTVLESMVSKVMGPACPCFAIISLDSPDMRSNLLDFLRWPQEKAVIISHWEGKETNFADCLYLPQLWDIKEVIAFLRTGRAVSGVTLFSSIYAWIERMHPESPTMQERVRHTLKYDPQYRFPQEAAGHWKEEEIVGVIRQESVDMASFYLRRGQPEIAREIARLVLDPGGFQRLQELYYQVIGRTRQELPPSKAAPAVEACSLEFHDDGRPIVAVVDDMFALAPEQYAEYQQDLKRCVGNYQLAWLRDGQEALDFYSRWHERLVLFLLDMNFQFVHHFLTEAGELMTDAESARQPDQEYKRIQGKTIANVLRTKGYKQGIVVFSAESKEERLSLYTSTPDIYFISKQDFFHQTEVHDKILGSLGIEVMLENRLQSMAKAQYHILLGEDVVRTVLHQTSGYRLGRRRGSLLQALLAEFPDNPPSKPEIDQVLTKDFIEKFAEDADYFDWYTELIRQQLGLEVCLFSTVEWPLMLLRRDKQYFLGMMTHEPWTGSQKTPPWETKTLSFQGPQAPFCLESHVVNYFAIPANFVDSRETEHLILKNLFWTTQTLFLENPGESWNILKKASELLGTTIWNPETTFYDADTHKAVTYEPMGTYLYQLRQVDKNKIPAENVLRGVFYFHDEPALFYESLLGSKLQEPKMSRYLRIYKSGSFMHEFEGRCFYGIANQFDAVFTDAIKRLFPNQHAQMLDKIQYGDYVLIANPHIGGREVDMILAARYCLFFIEIKAKTMSSKAVDEVANNLYHIINAKYRNQKGYEKENQAREHIFHCYRVLISQDQVMYPPKMTFELLHGNWKPNSELLPLICSAILENQFGKGQQDYRAKADTEGYKRFVNKLLSKKVELDLPKELLVPIDRYWIAGEVERRQQVSKLIEELVAMERWNNSHPLLFPYTIAFLDSLQQEVAVDEYHSIAYVNKKSLLKGCEIPASEWSRWNRDEKLSLLCDFFDRMQTADLEHLQVNLLTSANIHIIQQQDRFTKMYLGLDERGLRYSSQAVEKERHLAYQFGKLLGLLCVQAAEFFYHYTRYCCARGQR